MYLLTFNNYHSSPQLRMQYLCLIFLQNSFKVLTLMLTILIQKNTQTQKHTHTQTDKEIQKHRERAYSGDSFIPLSLLCYIWTCLLASAKHLKVMRGIKRKRRNTSCVCMYGGSWCLIVLSAGTNPCLSYVNCVTSMCTRHSWGDTLICTVVLSPVAISSFSNKLFIYTICHFL